MNNIITFPTIDFFGGCPKCGRRDGYLNVESDHWFYCERHRTKWWAGSNLFDGWKDENEMTWRRNAQQLAAYREVEPLEPAHGCQDCGAHVEHYDAHGQPWCIEHAEARS